MVRYRRAAASALTWALYAPLLGAWSGNHVPLTLLAPGTRGNCLDGSPGGFYLDKAQSNASRRKWAIELEGGMQCSDEEACRAAARTSLGSSRYFGKTLGQQTNFISYSTGDLKENPFFGTWNRVFIPYCSQDQWSGTRMRATAETFGMYFSGHLIFAAVIDYLVVHEGMVWATDLLLGGTSAGGIGSWLNIGHAIGELPMLQTAVHVPIAGFYFPTKRYFGIDWHEPWRQEITDENLAANVNLWQSHMDEHCTSRLKGQEHRCMLACYSAPYLPWKVFVVEAQSDIVQLRVRDGLPGDCHEEPECAAFMSEWQGQLMSALENGLKAQDGWFAPACMMHHKFFVREGPWVLDPGSGRELSYLEALEAFYVGKAMRLADNCGLVCGHCGAAANTDRKLTDAATANASEPFFT